MSPLRKKSTNGGNSLPLANEQVLPTGSAVAIDELSRQLLSWSHLWSAEPGGGKHRLVRERLAGWLERCIGRHTKGLVANHTEELSLETSTPLLVAFLGRRATRELSRQVLRDL